MKPVRLLVLLVAVVVCVAACGGDDGGDTTTPDQGQTSGDSNGDDGGGDDGSGGDGNGGDGNGAPVGGTAFPEGVDEEFPVLVPAGWEIDTYADLAEQGVTLTGGVSVYYPNNDFDRIVAFYDEWIETDTADYVRSVAGDDVIYSRMETPIYTITVSQNQDYQDTNYTLLVITVLEDPN